MKLVDLGFVGCARDAVVYEYDHIFAKREWPGQRSCSCCLREIIFRFYYEKVGAWKAEHVYVLCTNRFSQLAMIGMVVLCLEGKYFLLHRGESWKVRCMGMLSGLSYRLSHWNVI